MTLSDLHIKIRRASEDYFKVGLIRFHETRKDTWRFSQAALGNLSISIELMIKTCLANKCPTFCYSSLPLEIEMKLLYPETFGYLSFHQKRDVDNLVFKSQTLKTCIDIFYLMFPNEKIKLKPYLNFFTSIRNQSIHSALQDFQRIELDRIAYLALYLVKFLKSKNIFPKYSFRTTKMDESFFDDYNVEQIERLKKMIATATENAKSIKEKIFIAIDEDWDTQVVECPICKCDGILSGYSDIYGEEDGGYNLSFTGESFICSECKLELFDQTELSYAGVESEFTMDAEIDDYIRDNEYMSEYYDERDY